MPSYEHRERAPAVDPSAWIAPTAVLCGDVEVGAGCAICHGAVLNAEDGTIAIGRDCVVMEGAVLKASRHFPLSIGANVLIGPRAYLTGCTIGPEVFLAAGSTVFNRASIGRRAVVRINGVVHIRTRLPEGTAVPIGCVAIGDPVEILTADQDERIAEIQRKLGFYEMVFGVERAGGDGSVMPQLTRRYAAALRRHEGDRRLS